ncbi:DNA ligase [Nymphaea thermarum]|nr:DNA ligase [Nymphaea thermarum]
MDDIRYSQPIQVRNMRIGAMMRTVLPALAQAVVMNSSPSSSPEFLRVQLQSISAAVVEAYSMLPNLDLLIPSVISKGIQFPLSTVCMVPGVPIRPMLAKYDGQRAQVHRLMDGSIKVFSRNGEETTSRFPDLVKIISESSKQAAETYILDGEVVAVDRKNGNKIMPFQLLCSRERGGRGSSVEIDNIKVTACIMKVNLL